MLKSCFVIGVNYTTATISVRSIYSISTENQEQMLQKAHELNIPSLLILNTCNRTEIAGMGDAETVIQLYLTLNQLGPEHRKALFVKTGEAAVEHLFKVSSGLDSQIIGDLDILGQFKNAFQTAKKHNTLNGYYERLGNFCVQNAKEIRNNTNLSNGTTSHAYAVVKFLKDKQIQPTDSILLIGTGEFGTGVAKNIRDYLPEIKLSLTNRTDSKAQILAEQIGCESIAFADYKQHLNKFKVIIAAISNGLGSLFNAEDISAGSSKIMIDTSVPPAIDPALGNTGNHVLITVDDLSQYINSTIDKRKSDLPLATELLQKNLTAFKEWNAFQEKTESIKLWKGQLEVKAQSCPYLKLLPQDIIQHYVKRSVAQYAEFVRANLQVPEEMDQEAMLNTFLEVYHEIHVPKNVTTSQQP
ncbi:MAG: hypothetical protein WC760_08165 [Bacteroidia bacterium]|jgi:glutamyl-tRNA reductase